MSQLVMYEGVKFPSGEVIDEYVEELSPLALEIMETMNYVNHEHFAITRYMKMYNDYFSEHKKKTFSAETFATISASRKSAELFDEDDEEENETVGEDVAKSILEFLFGYYFSYHEAEVESGKQIELKSFSWWFDRKRKALGKKMRKEILTIDKINAKRKGRDLELFQSQLKKGKKLWKQKHLVMTVNKAEQEKTRIVYHEMKHFVNLSDTDIEKMSWEQLIAPKYFSQKKGNVSLKQILQRARFWSLFLHPDKHQKNLLGKPFHDLLVKRFNLLMDCRDEAMKSYHGATIDLT